MSYELAPIQTQEAGVTRFALTGELCIFHAAELKPQLVDLLEPAGNCEIDLAGVAEIDTSGVQLLLFAKREADQKGCSLTFTNHSDALLEMIELFNLSRDFGDPVLLRARPQEADHES